MRITLFLCGLIILFSGAAYADCTNPENQSETQYCYDALGRLTDVKYGGLVNTEYVYDDAGNRRSVISSVEDFECAPGAQEILNDHESGTLWKHCVSCFASGGVKQVNSYLQSAFMSPNRVLYRFHNIDFGGTSTQSNEVELNTSTDQINTYLTVNVDDEGQVTFSHRNMASSTQQWISDEIEQPVIALCTGDTESGWIFLDNQFETRTYATDALFQSINPENLVYDPNGNENIFNYIWSDLSGTGLTQDTNGVLSGDPIEGIHTITLTVTDPDTEQTDSRNLVIEREGPPNAKWVFIESQFEKRTYPSRPTALYIDPRALVSDPDSDVSSFDYTWSDLDETGLTQTQAGILQGDPTFGTHTINLTVTDPETDQTGSHSLVIEKETDEPWVFVESQFSDKFYQTTLPISPILPQTLVSDSDSDVSTFTYSWSGLSEAGLTQDSDGVLTGSVGEGRHILTVTVSDPNTTQTASHDLIVERQGSVYGICDPGTKKLIYRGSDADWRHCVTCNTSPAGGVTSVKTFMENNDLSPSQKIFEINRGIKPGDNWFAGRDFTNTSTGTVYEIIVKPYVSYEGEVTFLSTKTNQSTGESTQLNHHLAISCPVTDAEFKFANSPGKTTYAPEAIFEPIDPRHIVTDRDSDVSTFNYSWSGLENTGLQQDASGILGGNPVEGTHIVTLTVTDPVTGQTGSLDIEIEREASPYGTCSADEQEVTTEVYGSDWKHCVKCDPAGSPSRGEVESITSFLYNPDHSPTLTEFNVGRLKKGYQTSDRESVNIPYYGDVTYTMEYRFSIHRQLNFYFTNYRTDGSGWLNSTPVRHRVRINCPQ